MLNIIGILLILIQVAMDYIRISKNLGPFSDTSGSIVWFLPAIFAVISLLVGMVYYIVKIHRLKKAAEQ